MVFPWNIAKSAEALLSRYALKRVCKFVLKKKLGQFILGEIDLDQLDVQLAAGILQLTDLALNVDFLNEKLDQSSIFRVREGSIRALLVKMPWNGGGCEVEVDELELVLSPSCNERLHNVAENHGSKEESCMNHVFGKEEHDAVYNSSAASVNVHEGVKTIAKMVKWLLTSFHIRIKNVIVAFDGCLEKDEEKEGSHETLVLRVTEIECGTCISENRNSTDGAKAEDFLGISHLTNFLKFEGAAIELLQMNSDINQTFPASVQAASGCGSANASKPLLTGERGGFCGSVKLSIPWKNGSLDIREVDAEVNVDPLTAKLQPSTLKWILASWEVLQKCENEKVDNVYHKTADSFLSGLTSHFCSPASPSAMLSDEKLRQEKERETDLSVPLGEATTTNFLLEESRLISDWVPFSIGKYQNRGIEEADLGASVDQFFECFDGMRNSQSVLGSSGMWGWTGSVFSAISAASNLASGSLNISAEQQHLHTNLKITLVGLSIFFSFCEEDQLTQHAPAGEQVDNDSNVHHLGSRWDDILINVQVYPQEWKLEATVNHIVLDEYMNREEPLNFSLHDYENGASNQTLMIRGLQDRVQSTLPLNSMFADSLNPDVYEESPSSLLSTESCACRSSVVKANVFETSGASHCMFTVSSKSSGGRFAGQASFSLNLPPFIFWVNLDLVKLVLDSTSQLGNFSTKNGAGTVYSSEDIEKKHEYSAPSDVIWSCDHCNTSASCEGNLQGNIYLPHARIILCFPFKNGGGSRSHTSWDQFIALEFSSPPNFKGLKADGSALLQEETSWKKDYPSISQSVHLKVANLDVYHITKAGGDKCGSSAELSRQRFCAHKVLTLGYGTDWVRLISMLWHENAVTGAWILKSAKHLATSDDPASKMSSATSGYEFASVSTKKDMEDLSSQKQKEMILSSKFCLRVCLSSVIVTLCRSQYLSLFYLLNDVMDALSSVGSDTVCENRETTVNQTSIHVECGFMEVQIELDQEDCPKSCLQRELPGSWHKLRLDIQNLQLLSVSDVGAVSGASFFWISHCEGKLWGSITTLADQDILLITCSNSSSGRGEGEGSNVLSCRAAGSDFVYMRDPENFHNYMSIIVKCATVVAPGGRLDWLDKISSFFRFSSPETDEVAGSLEGSSERASFVLKLLDAALSYEPYARKFECLNSRSACSRSFDEKPCDPYVACLLAASSLTLCNTTIAGTYDNAYSIRIQDVGLLLHAVSKHENILVEYSVDHLRELGYVKVAGEALLNATLRINSENGMSWELYCSDSHIVLSTCHDTTFGLIRLASQIQQLFAPDIEESIVHLQNRWNSLQQAQGKDDTKGELKTSSDDFTTTSQVQQSSPDSKGNSGLVGLMDEICEDAFLFCGEGVRSFDGPELTISGDGNLHNEGPNSTSACSKNCVEGCHTSNIQKAELIESYCLSDLRSLSELTMNSYFSEEISKTNLVSRENRDPQRGNGGWYGRTSVRILENYASDETGCSSSKQPVDGQYNKEECEGSKKYKGRVLLKNIEVKWRMYAGSDWHEIEKTVQHSGDICGRDGTVCLELELSNMNIQHDIFPDGDIRVSKLCLSVQDFFLYDKSRYAPWKLVLGYYHSKERPRESSSKALKLNLEAVRPDSTTPLEEYRLCIALLPMLLHLHQNQLDFLITFFGGKYSPSDQSPSCSQELSPSDVISAKDNSEGVGVTDEALLPFFQKFDIWPIILRVDYRPSRVDLAALSRGKYVELVNLVPWKGVELQLKHVQAVGVYGWSNVCETAIGEWLEDISHNQIHKLLQGLPTIRSFVAVGSGATKLVSLPVKNYRKDYRLVKGLQRGTVAFLRSISVEALGLGVHLAAGAHDILLHAECILTHIQPSVPRPIRSQLKTNLRTDQPEGAQRGFEQAVESFSDGWGKTTAALVQAPIRTYQRGSGVGSAFVTAVRGAPAAAIAPASAAAQALHCALLGVRNSLDPERKKESMNKYLGPSHYYWDKS